MKLRKYTEQDLRQVVVESFSLRETLLKLNVTPAGGNYEVLKKAILYFNIDTSHFLGMGYLKGKTHEFKLRPLSEILVEDKIENTFRLKARLIKEGIKQHICENCKLTKWLGELVPLELHHKDGNRKNNTIQNLALLCPNCHVFTENYRGKNKSRCGGTGIRNR